MIIRAKVTWYRRNHIPHLGQSDGHRQPVVLRTFPHSPDNQVLTVKQKDTPKTVHGSCKVTERRDRDTQNSSPAVWDVSAHRNVSGDLNLLFRWFRLWSGAAPSEPAPVIMNSNRQTLKGSDLGRDISTDPALESLPRTALVIFDAITCITSDMLM